MLDNLQSTTSRQVFIAVGLHIEELWLMHDAPAADQHCLSLLRSQWHHWT